MNVRYIVFVLMVFMFLGLPVNGQNTIPQTVQCISIDPVIDEGGALWSLSPDVFMSKFGQMGFSWTSSQEKKTARAYLLPLTFNNMPVCEAIVRFEDQKAVEVVMSIYNRGDVGEIGKIEFERLLKGAEERMGGLTKVRAAKAPTQLDAGGVNKEGLVWNCANNQFILESSYSTGGNKAGYSYRPEYIRIKCQSTAAGRNYQSSMQSKQNLQGGVSGSMLKSNVKSEGIGDVFIDSIPMVDQGLKGYCVVATMERVMRYYGKEVDQHELAQLAQTQTGGGTSMEAMINVLRKLGLAVGCKVIVHEDWDWKNFQRLVDSYNRTTKKKGGRQIMLPDHGVINVSELYDQFEVRALRETKLQKKSDFSKFKNTIQKYVKQGIPLPWTVCAGIVEETPPVPQRGPHMRMIIGYNTKTSEVIYSDSWGAGHEKKKMLMDNAWAITDGLYTVEPRTMTY